MRPYSLGGGRGDDAALSLSLGVRMRNRDARTFALLCLMQLGMTGYPLLHATFALPIQPWYALEIAAGAVCSYLIVLLQNRLSGARGLARAISEAALAAFIALSLCYGLFSAHLTIPLMRGYSALAAAIKWLSARRQGGRFLSRKPGAPRQGIGLASAGKIIAAHGGTFDVYPGETAFTVGITLPVGEKPPAE